MKYRKRPVIIDAIQWTGPSQVVELERFIEERSCLGSLEYDADTAGIPDPETGADWGRLSVDTLESNEHVATPGDWLIRGVKGELYFCKPDVFASTYEPVDAA